MIVVLDASCSRFFTHNASYMQAYAKRAHELNLETSVECWIGEAADSEVRKSFSLPVFPILRSPIYSFQKNQPFFYYRNKLLSLIQRCLSKLNENHFLSKGVGKLIFDFYSSPAIARANQILKLSKEIHFILPSADGFSLRLTEKMINDGFPVRSLVIRTIAAESRGFYGINNLSEFIHGLKENFPEIDIRVGWECKTIANELSEQGLHISLSHWAPMPTNKIKMTQVVDRPLCIGFLGEARRNKGFDAIPEIISCLKTLDVSANYVVQLSSSPWITYEQTLQRIRELAPDTKFLHPRLKHDRLMHEISMVSVLVMPYLNSQYKRAGSGILYHAADYLVPSLTFEGLGFSWDIECFEIGVTFDSVEQLKSIINNFSIQKWRNNCYKYNNARDLAVNSLLSLHTS